MTDITSSTLWWEIQGLALCPSGDHPGCTAPEKGEWHTLYHLTTKDEARRALIFVLDNSDNDEWLDHFEDFRIAPPDEDKVRAKARADKRRAEMRNGRRVA